jgi:hypothetical protein
LYTWSETDDLPSQEIKSLSEEGVVSFEWDERKRRSNIERHGLVFRDRVHFSMARSWRSVRTAKTKFAGLQLAFLMSE